MLRSTYLHVPGVGETTERRIWAGGIYDWREFHDRHGKIAMGEVTRANIISEISRSESALSRGDAGHFARCLKSGEHWRLYSEFYEKAAFLDIETTGLGRTGDYITVVGVHDSDGTRCFVKDLKEQFEVDLYVDTPQECEEGQGFETALEIYDDRRRVGTGSAGNGEVIQVLGMEELPGSVSGYDMLVTFNGSQFDIPFLRREFPEIEFPAAHLDLRFFLRRLGFKGGLKSIEPEFDLYRPGDLESMNGYDAVRLWMAHKRGNPDVLEKLLRYNACDVVNLRVLADRGASMMETAIRGIEVR